MKNLINGSLKPDTQHCKFTVGMQRGHLSVAECC